MDFVEKEVCLTHSLSGDYTASVCFNGEFYQARIVHPPTPNWNQIGIGRTEREALDALMAKIGTQNVA